MKLTREFKALNAETGEELFEKRFASPQEFHQHVRDIESRVSTAQTNKEIAKKSDLDALDALVDVEFVIVETLKYF